MKLANIYEWIETATRAELKEVSDAAFQRLQLLNAMNEYGVDLGEERAKAQAQVLSSLREDFLLAAPVVPADPKGVEDFPKWVDPMGRPARMYLNGDHVSHNGRVWVYQGAGVTGLEPGSPASGWVDVTTQYFDAAPAAEPANAWVAGASYTAGDTVSYGGRDYLVVADHVGDEAVTPDVGEGLYEPLGE